MAGYCPLTHQIIYMYVCVCMHVYVCMCVYACVCTYVCVSTFILTCALQATPLQERMVTL